MMFSKTLGTFMLAVSLSTPMVAQVVETPPSQTSWGYVNEEEKERFEQIIAPFESGEVGPMNPSNYENLANCEEQPQYLEWLRLYREDPKSDTVAQLNIYTYLRQLNVLETRDCSCKGYNPPTDHTQELVADLPISKLTGWIIKPDFYMDLRWKTRDLAEAFCGGVF
jgi:hypothetical protein